MTASICSALTDSLGQCLRPFAATAKTRLNSDSAEAGVFFNRFSRNKWKYSWFFFILGFGGPSKSRWVLGPRRSRWVLGPSLAEHQPKARPCGRQSDELKKRPDDNHATILLESCRTPTTPGSILRSFSFGMSFLIFPVFGRFSAKLGPRTPLERRGSSCSAGCTKNQPRRPILRHGKTDLKYTAKLTSNTDG